MSNPVVYTNLTISSVKETSELRDEYIAVSKRLHGDQFDVTQEEFQVLLDDPKELVAFALVDGQLVATAQATLMWTPPQLQAYINNVVTHPQFGGRGLGRIVMNALEEAVKTEWGNNGSRSINLSLSNSPKKSNGGFYEKLGWTNRGPDSASLTVVWIKTI
jgi:ribosomal protein S18 acetylase RimI-like enzyme